MDDKKGRFRLADESPLFQLLVSVALIIGVGTALSIILLVGGLLVTGTSLSQFSLTDESNAGLVRYYLAIQDLCLFILPASVIMKLRRNEDEPWMRVFGSFSMKEAILVLIMALCIFPVTSFTGEINSMMHFPDWMSGIGKWVEGKEEMADKVTGYLAESKSFPMLMLNLFIIALLPALGEEMVFRGVFQKIFCSMFRSYHTAIWITAFIFSFVHLQFFGFIPRLILGAVFGYLFYWSGKLWLPIAAHFVNNGFPLIISFIYGPEALNSTDNIPLWKQGLAVPLPLFVVAGILLYFRKKYSVRQAYPGK